MLKQAKQIDGDAMRRTDDGSGAFYMYVLKCADNTLYTGYTTDLEHRIAVHAAGKGAKYTRARLPVQLLAFATFTTKHEAMSAEFRFKRLSRAQKDEMLVRAQTTSFEKELSTLIPCTIRAYQESDIPEMMRIWNLVVAAGNAFPQENLLTDQEASEFFAQQSLSAVAQRNGAIVGLYILHPNNVGRCSHIANASYAVDASARGGGVGRALVQDSIAQAGTFGFRGLQFNAVVASNTAALALYEDLGFTRIGTIPGGFKNGEGAYEDIIIFYISC